MRPFLRLLTATMLCAPWLFTAAPANAQAPSTMPAAPAEISDQKLDAAAKALTRVASIQQDYQQRVAAAPTGDRQRLVEEANVAMTKAVAEQGMSVDEYNAIIDTAQKVPAVRQKLQQRLGTPPE